MRVELAILVATSVLPGFAQEASRQLISKPSGLPPPVINLPYSAELRQTRFQVLEGGTRLTESRPVSQIYRDAKGDLRIDRALVDSYEPPDSPRIVLLDDAQEHVRYILEPRRKVAHRFSVQARNAPDQNPRDGSEVVTEQLGTWVIQNLRAQGVRRTIALSPIAPAGGTIVRETWTVPELQLVVLETVKDPRSGEATYELTNIRTGDPDDNLFRVPPDYKIVEETDTFSIAFKPHWHSTPPIVLTKIPAKFTADAVRNHIQGTVGLAMVIDEEGKAQEIHVERPLDPGLDQEAIKAVQQWLFRPGQRDGHPTRTKVQVDVVFSVDQ